jgi:hypothetical protein
MICWAALLTCPTIVLAQDENPRPARSPSEVAQYINRHRDIHWGPLLKGFGIGSRDLPLHCGSLDLEPCAAEIIQVPGPPQVILRIKGAWWQETYWRFLEEASGWRFRGSFSPFVKYFKPRHQIISFGGKPFLLINAQGEAGSGLSSEYQDWFDLTRPNFKPVFGFTVKGVSPWLLFGITRSVESHVSALEAGSTERITIARRVMFSFEPANGNVSVESRCAESVYARQPNGKFEFEAALSTCGQTEIEDLYEDFFNLSREDFLRYEFDQLKEIVAGPDASKRVWLGKFLQLCENTPEKRSLKSLFAGRPQR